VIVRNGYGRITASLYFLRLLIPGSYVLKYILPCFILLFTLSCSDSTIEDAQNFKPDLPPVISNVTVTDTSGGANPEVNLVPNMQFKITADVMDPENAGVTCTFASDQGSFAGQETTATGVNVIFVTGELTANESITVTLTAKDPTRNNNSDDEIISIGTAKPLPHISISPISVTVTSNGTAVVTLTADCTGSFQLVQNDTAASSSEIHLVSGNAIFGIETVTGTNKSTTATIYGQTATAGADMNHTIRISGATGGTHKIWAVFQDLLGQEEAVLCTVNN
jgi:hypothetical protein